MKAPVDTQARAPENGVVKNEPGALDVARRLRQQGASEPLVKAVLTRLRRTGASGAHAIDEAASILARVVPILPSLSARVPGGPTCIAFVGPVGSGKTTALASLAQRMNESGRRVVVASLDREDPLQGAAPAGGPVFWRGRNLERALRRHPNADCLLIDTPGLPAADHDAFSGLADELSVLPFTQLHPVLVLSAASPLGTTRFYLERFGKRSPFGLSAKGACLTRIDEAARVAPSLEELRRTRLPLLFLCDGDDGPQHLWRATPGRVADLFLRGKVA